MSKKNPQSYETLLELDNLFSLGPARKEKIWADKKKLKETLEGILRISLATSPTKMIVYYGDYGSGKTHSMRYFTNPDNLKPMLEEQNIRMPIAIPIICPRNQIFITFYKKIIENMWSNLTTSINKIDDEIEKPRQPEQLEQKLNEYVKGRNLSKVLAQLTIPDKKMLVEKYLLLTAKSADLNSLGVPRGIETYLDMLETLTDLFYLLLEYYENNLRIIIWIDEAEHVFKLPGKELIEFQGFLRDIIDHIPRNLLIFINASLKPGEEVQDFMDYLGDPVSRRVNRVIGTPTIRPEEAIEYIEDYVKIAEANPFEDNTINGIVKLISENSKEKGLFITPGLINKVLTFILEKAYSEGKATIDKEFVNKIEDELLTTVFS